MSGLRKIKRKSKENRDSKLRCKKIVLKSNSTKERQQILKRNNSKIKTANRVNIQN